MQGIAEIVAMARDIALLLLFLVLMIVALVVYAKVSSLLDSARRTVRDVERIASTVNSRFARRLMGASAAAFSAGKAAAFVAGLRQSSDEEDRKQLKEG